MAISSVGHSGPHQTERYTSLPLPWQPPSVGPRQRTVTGPKGEGNLHLVQLQLAPETGEKPPRPSPTPGILGSSVRYSKKHHISPTREDSGYSRENFSGPIHLMSKSLSVPGNHWHNDLHDPHGHVGPVAVTPFPVRIPPAMEIRRQEPNYPCIYSNEEQHLLVASVQKPT